MPKLLVVEVDPSGECKNTQYRSFIEKGYALYFLIAAEKHAHLYRPNVRVAPGRTAQDFVDEAAKWHESEQFDGVVTLTEFSVIATSLIASRLGKPGLGDAAGLACRNKFFMRQAHEKGGVNHPAFSLAHDEHAAADFADRIGYPVVIKPTLGGGSEHIYKIASREQMLAVFPKALEGISIHSFSDSEPQIADRGPNGILVEAYLNGNEHSLEAWVWDGEVTIGAIGDRLSPEGNLFDNDIYTMPTRLDAGQIEAIRELVEKAAKAQGIVRGTLHPEIRYHNGTPYLVEMGARAGGGPISHMTRAAYGYCPVQASFDMALGIKPVQPALQPTGRVVLAIAMICDEGRIQHISVPPEAERSPELIYFKIFLSPGDINLRPPHGNILLGQICATGNTLEQAYRHADSIYKRVVVTLAAIN
ncbi:ATP-grasp domain-containing protein [Paraburkholderia dilworthii]|uniref:ATP-grasp domain-containing protein n=1 Tax=Paraburkholderia dilworthii TaxID=948106 RepID=A0ABW9D204_9BURK